MKNIHAAPTASMSSEVAELWACFSQILSRLAPEKQKDFLLYCIGMMDIMMAIPKVQKFIAGLSPDAQKEFRENFVQCFAEELSELE